MADFKPRLPRGLGAGGKAFWQKITSAYEFESSDVHRLEILAQACSTLDMIDRLKGVINSAESLRTFGSQGQLVAIPELAELRQYQARFESLVKSMNLPLSEQQQIEASNARSSKASNAAQARWSS